MIPGISKGGEGRFLVPDLNSEDIAEADSRSQKTLMQQIYYASYGFLGKDVLPWISGKPLGKIVFEYLGALDYSFFKNYCIPLLKTVPSRKTPLACRKILSLISRKDTYAHYLFRSWLSPYTNLQPLSKILMECNHEYISLFFQETEKDFNWLDEKCIKANGLEKTYIERKCLETKETKGWPVAPYIEKERVLVVSPMPHEELVLCSKKPVSTIFFPPVSRLLRFLKNLKIYLYHSKIPESIGRFYALERLTCKIQRVKTRFPIEAISSLPVLSYLRLNGTGIRDLGDVLKPLQFLKTLDLRNNLLRDISSPFHPRAELSRCDFSHNQIKRICFGGADQIQDLDLSHNLLGDLGDTLKPLQFLKILDLSNNLLRDISSPFHPMAGLSRCNFSHNQIEKIRFGGAHQIWNLDLSHNLLGDLGDTLKPLQFLTILNLRHNSLSDVSSPFHPRASLSSCDFSHNRIKQICLGLVNTYEMRDLDLSHNLLPRFDLDIHVRVLNVSHNRLKHLDLRNFGVYTLHAQHNFLRDGSLMVSACCIRYMNLSFNYLSGFFLNEYGSFSSCTTLNLRANCVWIVPAWIDEALPVVESLDLGDNVMRFLPESIGRLRSLRILSLKNHGLRKIPKELAQLPLRVLNLSSDIYYRLSPEMEDRVDEIQNCQLKHHSLVERTIAYVLSIFESLVFCLLGPMHLLLYTRAGNFLLVLAVAGTVGILVTVVLTRALVPVLLLYL